MPIELWGGVECTVNRVGDVRFDQLRRSGHWDRPEDLDRFAALGIKALRFPLLWEHVAPDGDLSKADWSWHDARLERLRDLGVRPIAGLVHHGSGPSDTHLLDPDFPRKLAEYARACAQRYPWIDEWTPVNEPLTTARFSALYGLWYPHAKDFASMKRALVHQCAGIAAAMRAIRLVNPKARLIQTEDLGRVTSTPKLAYQAAFENERRWLSYDLLFGRLDPRALVPGTQLDVKCPPDVVGVNYYLTSDRWLDEEPERWPPEFRGGNEQDRYADIHSVVVPESGLTGHERILLDAWERYGAPVALTEVHMDATREDQLRWLAEAWEAAHALERRGAGVAAVTAWALLGSFDWNCLVTRDNGYYEPGAFDIRGARERPRATAVARMLEALGHGRPPSHPVLGEPGWWRRRCRVYGGPLHSVFSSPSCDPAPRGTTPLLIAGGGTLGRAFARACGARALSHVLVKRGDMDVADEDSVERALERHRPWAVVNAAGYVRVDDAEREPERCWRENALGAQIVARACARRGIPLLTFSSDLVFGGEKLSPYVERDPTAPVNVYGRSKAAAEKLVASAWPSALVVRTSAFFGPWDDANFLSRALRSWEERLPFEADDRQVVTPTFVPDLARVSLDLLIDGQSGLWHIANPEPVTWLELALRLARLTGAPPELVVPLNGSRERLAPRPAYSALGSERGVFLPPLQHCLERYLAERPA